MDEKQKMIQRKTNEIYSEGKKKKEIMTSRDKMAKKGK